MWWGRKEMQVLPYKWLLGIAWERRINYAMGFRVCNEEGRTPRTPAPSLFLNRLRYTVQLLTYYLCILSCPVQLLAYSSTD